MEVKLSGKVEAKEVHEVTLKPEVWTEWKIETVVDAGADVAEGDRQITGAERLGLRKSQGRAEVSEEDGSNAIGIGGARCKGRGGRS